eukprot:957733-Rhodomonas_salina.1
MAGLWATGSSTHDTARATRRQLQPTQQHTCQHLAPHTTHAPQNLKSRLTRPPMLRTKHSSTAMDREARTRIMCVEVEEGLCNTDAAPQPIPPP